jgi:hypothetical protein
MPDTKISALAQLSGTDLAGGDQFPAVDVSDTTMASSGTTKRISTDDMRIAFGAPLIVVKSADQSSSDASTLSDVTGLSWPIVANGVYVFAFDLWVLAAATTTGLVIAVNGPTLGTGYLRYGYETPTSATARWQSAATAFNTALVATGVPSTTTAHLARVKGYLSNGANAGTLQLRMRSEVAGSSVTIQRGSYGKLTRLA